MATEPINVVFQLDVYNGTEPYAVPGVILGDGTPRVLLEYGLGEGNDPTIRLTTAAPFDETPEGMHDLVALLQAAVDVISDPETDWGASSIGA